MLVELMERVPNGMGEIEIPESPQKRNKEKRNRKGMDKGKNNEEMKRKEKAKKKKANRKKNFFFLKKKKKKEKKRK